MFIVLLKYIRPINEVDQHLIAHREFLDKAYKLSHLLCSGPMNPREGGVLLAKSKTKNELETFLKDDPFKIHGIADYQIIEFNPVKMSDEFSKCL